MSATDLQNPFCLEPVRTPAQFFGRKEKVQEVLSLLDNRQSVAVAGPAKIGKTSFLAYVANPQVRAQYGRAEEHIFVHLDSRSLAAHDRSQCYLLISEEIICQVKNTESVHEAIGIELERVVCKDGSEPASIKLRTLCETVQDKDLKLVLLLDDFEFLADRFRLEYQFFAALRALITYQIAYLIAAQSQLHTLERAIPEDSPFFNIFHQIILNPLTPGEGHELVAALLEQADIEFPQFVIDCILEVGSNEPYRLKKALHTAFKVWQESQGNLQAKHCEEIREVVGR